MHLLLVSLLKFHKLSKINKIIYSLLDKIFLLFNFIMTEFTILDDVFVGKVKNYKKMSAS